MVDYVYGRTYSPLVVLLLEEPLDLVEAVPVDGLDVLRGEPHGDDALVDVGEVQVEAIVHVAPLLLRHDRLQRGRHPRQIRPAVTKGGRY